MATTSDKLETCEVCAASKAKYTCPKCEVRTCGLQCVNIHKKELECDGIRDKTKFIPLNSFTDLDLLSDYRLLENIGRSVEQLQKNPEKKCTRQQNPLPPHLHKLKNSAHHRGINLEFMPHNFSRHKKNSTYYNWKTNELSWRVELIFTQAENIKWVIDRVLETKRLSVLLEEIFNFNTPTESETDESLNKLSVLHNKLKYYKACGLTGLKALLKAEKVKKSDSRFFELDLTQSLAENLKNKTIIEFPIIYIVMKDHSNMFEIIDSDDEEIKSKIDNQHKFKRKYPENNRKMIKKRSVSPKKEDSSVNYFFNAEISDSEDENITETNNQRSNHQELHIPNYDELVKMET